MKPESSPESAGQSILQRLGIAEDPLVGVDPVSFLRSLAAAGIALAKDPGAAAGIAAANARLAIGSAAAVRASAGACGRQRERRTGVSGSRRQTVR